MSLLFSRNAGISPINAATGALLSFLGWTVIVKFWAAFCCVPCPHFFMDIPSPKTAALGAVGQWPVVKGENKTMLDVKRVFPCKSSSVQILPCWIFEYYDFCQDFSKSKSELFLGGKKKSCSQVCRAPCLPLRPSQISHQDLVLSCKYHLPDLLLQHRLLIITCVCLVSPNVIFFSILNLVVE